MPQALWNGVVIADSDDTIVVEGNHYFPLEAVDERYLVESDSHSVCPLSFALTTSAMDIARKNWTGNTRSTRASVVVTAFRKLESLTIRSMLANPTLPSGSWRPSANAWNIGVAKKRARNARDGSSSAYGAQPKRRTQFDLLFRVESERLGAVLAGARGALAALGEQPRAAGAAGLTGVERRVAPAPDLAEGDPPVGDARGPGLRPAFRDRHPRRELAGHLSGQDREERQRCEHLGLLLRLEQEADELLRAVRVRSPGRDRESGEDRHERTAFRTLRDRERGEVLRIRLEGVDKPGNVIPRDPDLT